MRKRQLKEANNIARLSIFSKDQVVKAIKEAKTDEILESYSRCVECGNVWFHPDEMNNLMTEYEIIEDFPKVFDSALRSKIRHDAVCEHAAIFIMSPYCQIEKNY